MIEGLVAVLLMVATILGVLVGVRIQARRDALGMMIAPPRGHQRWIPPTLLALLVALLGVVTLIGIQRLSQWADREQDFVRKPLGEVRITRSANGSTVDPWRVSHGSAGTALQVDPAPASARGRDGALRVTVNLPSAWDTAAIQVPGAALPDRIAVATAWVYLENSGAARDAGLHARLVARMRAGSNGSFSLVGDRTPLTPGEWTQVVWTGSYGLELSRALGDSTAEKSVRASEQLTSLGLRLEADRSYRGSVFVDDLRVYAADASRGDPR